MLKKHLKQYRKELILGPFFKLIEAVFELAIPLIMAKAIDEGIKQGDMNLVMRYIIIMVILTILGFVASITCQYYAGIAGYGVGAKIRNSVFSHIMDLDAKMLEKNNKQYLINTVTSDSEQIQNAINMFIRLASRAPFLIIGAIILAFFINTKIAIIFLVVSVIISIFIFFLSKYTIKYYVASQGQLDVLARLTKEAKTGDKVIRAFSKQEYTNKKFEKDADYYDTLQRRIGKINSFLQPTNYLLINLGILFILYLGSNYINEGTILQGQMVALVNYFGQILASLILFINLVMLFTRAFASYKRIMNIMNLDNSLTIGEFKNNKEDELLRLENVSFAFSNQTYVLKDLNITLLRNTSIGIIGRTGSGKSTLLELLTRGYDPTEGNIYYYGRNLKSMPRSEVLRHFGIAFQSAYLFSGTVRSNLLMANQSLPEDETFLENVLEKAQAKFVFNKKDGLDANIVQGGLNFSGGQRQRLNIARALVNNPEVLILDDSSSALNFKTDFELRKELSKLSISTIIVTQRVASIAHCNQIIVLEKGMIVGLGKHEELMQNNDFYREIAFSQGVKK